MNNFRLLSFFAFWILIFHAEVNAQDSTFQNYRADLKIADFEQADYRGWKVEGDAFGDGPVSASKTRTQGFRGQRFANSFGRGDAALGSIESPVFEINRKFISFLICGGRQANQVGISLMIDGKEVRSATGSDSEVLRWVAWDVEEFKGKIATLKVYDRSQAGWGQITVDEVIMSDQPRFGSGTLRLEDYRRSREYYTEEYRPQFHFTPELNWMNDPNGLVYFEGEYHLFYQHNPHGMEWGHMSWGHAVSRDLMHWEHLPIALHEEYGVMAFSGSCVIDEKNTSGFGKDGQIPMVAIYTGHGHGRQTQDLAYSLDRGRTWTKYEDNPVLDLQKEDFRDPKVFWHEATQKWIMVVSLAVEKKIHFYGSTDLKDWKLLSEFGPAGVKDKPNWECPDLFELPIVNEPGKTHWVLEVDIGSGAIAGGSGGEYFTGIFDGERFTADSMESQWVDYGRDFYAPISWSGIPKKDGRRIWIGWMNNWETCLNPTFPWRSAMSVPRELTLRRIDGVLRLCQKPVKEVELYDLTTVVDEEVLKDRKELVALGPQFDLFLEFEPKEASEFGVELFKGPESSTVVGYDVVKGQLFVDRRKSGNTDFHPAFAGKHSGPLKPDSDGKIRIRILVDACSVEVFGNDGETVITDLVFPKRGSDQVELYTKGGECQVVIRVCRMKSVWKHDSPK